MATNEIKLKLVIDGKEANATIDLTDDNIKELYKSFKYGKQEVNGLTTAISQGFNNAREILQGFREVKNNLDQTFGESIRAYQEQEKAVIQLSTAMKQNGTYTKSALDSLVAYSSELQATTVYGDEVTLSVMAQLQAMGLNAEQTKAAVLQSANLATVMNVDLNTAARAMADLFNGNVGMMGRYIKGLDETIVKSGNLDKIMLMLNERIGGQAEAVGNSAVGAMVKMDNAVGDLKENTGMLINNALQPMAGAITGIVSGLNKLSPGLSGLIGTVVLTTSALVTLKVTGITGAATAMMTTLIPSLNATKIAALGLGGALTALTAGLFLITELNRQMKEAREYDDMIELQKQHAAGMAGQFEMAAKGAELVRDQFKKATDEQIRQQIKLRELEIQNLDAKKESTKEDRIQIELYQREMDVFNKMLAERKKAKEEAAKSSGITKDQIQRTLFEYGGVTLEDYRNYLTTRLEMLKGATHEERQLIIALRNELERLNTEYAKPEVPLDFEIPEDIVLEDVQRGDKNEYARLNAEEELDIWYDKELEKVSMYENSEEVMFELSEEYDRRKRELEEAAAINSIEMAGMTLGAIGGMFAKHTLAYKAFTLFQIIADTIQASIAAYKSTAEIPIIGPALAPAAAAAAAVYGGSKIKELEDKPIPAYERGGVVVGENGPEIITPMQDYASGWADVVSYTKAAVEGSLGSSNGDLGKQLNNFISELKTWERELTFKLKAGDLVTGYDQEKENQLAVQY